MKKYHIYQVFTRLFGNTLTTNKPWGTIEQNGVGKFDDFTHVALNEIKQLGISHIWYTGVPHHALLTDYSQYGIENDHPSIVKGRAGSPYAVKDYYSVNPDLANNPSKRNEEFEQLIDRSHQHGLKVIIDIVPNHIARQYKGLNNPANVSDFGSNDDCSVEYRRDNNFYYIPNTPFEAPELPSAFSCLTDAHHSLSPFNEVPAKWTGNGSRLAKPNFSDWYETVKINYGVRPDGSYDFDLLPAEFAEKDTHAHYLFWRDKTVPDSWIKFRDIALFWLDKGVDGFRYDMAEMVPVEFWSYLNSQIKNRNPDAFLMAEVYQPEQYRDYIQLGKMDYLYDKVDLYDTLKAIMQGKASTHNISAIQRKYADIEHHLLHFLDNHDEQRIASPDFIGDPARAKPAMLVSALISTSPTMIYFGQEVGEMGAENAGFGQPSRTSIFDYVGVPQHQKWMNHGQFDGGLLSPKEQELRVFYQSLLTFALEHHAMTGHFEDLTADNHLNEKCYAFIRYTDSHCETANYVIAMANFDPDQAHQIKLTLPDSLVTKMNLVDGHYWLEDQIETKQRILMTVVNGRGNIILTLPPLASLAFCYAQH